MPFDGKLLANGCKCLSRELSLGASFSCLWGNKAGSGVRCLNWVWAITNLSWEVGLRDYDKFLLDLRVLGKTTQLIVTQRETDRIGLFRLFGEFLRNLQILLS